MMVLDTSAVLALMLGEAGRDRVAEEMETDLSILSCVNAAEVIGVVMRKGGLSHQEASAALRDLELIWSEPTDTQAVRAAELSTVKGLALGDGFCIALAEELGRPLLTGDRDWRQVPIRTPVEYIR